MYIWNRLLCITCEQEDTSIQEYSIAAFQYNVNRLFRAWTPGDETMLK